MTTALDRACNAARAVQKRLNGTGVTYETDADSFTVAGATAGRTRWQSQDARGQVVTVFSHDWIVDVADLAITPERDHKVIRTVNGRTSTYQVLPFGPEGRVWRWHDRACTTRRIYTKLISEVES
jgi:hypothetical protein